MLRFFSEKKSVAGIQNIFELLMTMVQRKYKIIKDSLLKGLTEEVNEQIQREYKDKEGFLCSLQMAMLAALLFSKTGVASGFGLLATGG